MGFAHMGINPLAWDASFIRGILFVPLKKRLDTTWGNENRINKKRHGTDTFSGTQKSFPLSLPGIPKILIL